MQNGPDFDKFIEPIVKIYQKLEYELIYQIASHFKLYEPIGFKNSMEWYIKKIEELGGLNQEAIEIISKQTQIPKNKIIKMLKDVGISTIDLDTVDKLNATRDYKINIDKLTKSQSFTNIINNSYKEIDGIFKMIHTNALQGMQESYMSVLNQAYTEVQSGISDYNSAIRKALTKMANQGITVVSYKQKNGKIVNYGIESCVRRDILTAIVQCTNNATTQFAKDMKAEYYEVSQHLGARVTNTHDYKDHSWWQGKVYKINGSTKEYPNYQETCNEGNVQGIAGANCRHIKWPFWPGISVSKNIEISPEENQKIYELNKQQNAYERTIRDYKRQIGVAKESDDVENYNLYKEKLKKIDKEYNDFCKEQNLKRRFSREYIVENVQNENGFTDVTNQWLEYATPNSHEVKDREYFIDKQGIKYKVDGKNVVLDYSDDEKQCAIWLENTFGGEIYMNPKVNFPKGINTADYLWRNELWDKKSMKKSTSLIRAFDNAIKDHESQANNFILDITDCKLNDKTVLVQVKNAFNPNNKLYRNWLQKVIVKRGEKLISVIVKK